MDHSRRVGKHKRDQRFELLLEELNNELKSAQSTDVKPPPVNKYPILFIMGCARSGTTLFSQWLASLGHFCYPSNFISRFYKAPGIGAKIQKLMIDLDLKEEILSMDQRRVHFNSELGKSKGWMQPHEFWYFWRRFFKFGDIQQLTEEQLGTIDIERFRAELAQIEEVFDRPLMLKGMILNWHVPYLYQFFNNSLFVHIQREPVANMQSLIRARESFFNSPETWYSFKPPEYPELKECSVEEQVAGQVYYTNQAVEQGLSAIPPENGLRVNYESFCNDPQEVYQQIFKKFEELGNTLDATYNGATSFREASAKLDPSDILSIAYAKYTGPPKGI